MIKVSSINTKPQMITNDGMWDKSITEFKYDLATHTLSVNQITFVMAHHTPIFYEPIRKLDDNGVLKSILVYSPYHNSAEDIMRYINGNEILSLIGDNQYAGQLEFYGVSTAMMYMAGGYLGPDYYDTVYASYAVYAYFKRNQYQIDLDVDTLRQRIMDFTFDYYRQLNKKPVIYGDLDQEIENYMESHKPRPKSKSDVAINLAAEAIDTGVVDPESSNWQVKVANYVKSKLWLEHDYSYEDAVKYARIAYDYISLKNLT